MLRKLSAILLSLALLLGCLGLAVHAADGELAPYRVVSTYYGEGKQGFHWYTKADCASEVVVDGKTYAGTSTEYQGFFAHRVVAQGLAPGTEYTYKIGDWEGSFKTNPGRGVPFSCIVTGDVQASDAAGFAYSAATVGKAWEMFPDAAFTVTLGDHTNNSNNEEWDLYFDAFQGIHKRAAFVPIAGNHDGFFKWDWFRNMFTLKEQPNITNRTGVYYSFDYGDVHFAVLNTNDMYPMSMQQRNWLVNDMKRTDAKWKIVFMHKSPYSAGNDALSPDVLLLRRALIPLFDQLGVDLVMYGHDHQYYRSQPVRADKPVGAESYEQMTIKNDIPEYPPVDVYTNPKGAIYILPCAACNKRYPVHENMLPAVRECAVKHENPGKPVFTSLSVSGGRLTYTAYTYDPAEKTAALYDEIIIEKTRTDPPDPNYKPLPTDPFTTFPQQAWNFISELFTVVVFDYLATGLLWNLIMEEVGG